MSAQERFWLEEDSEWAWGRFSPLREVESAAWVAPLRPDWSQLSGRISEISSRGGVGLVSVGLALAYEAQRQGHWPVWVSMGPLPFVEDVEASGIDLRAWVGVRVSTPAQALRAAEHALRSGCCGTVCVDLGGEDSTPTPMMGRLMRFAQQQGHVCVFLTRRSLESPSISPLVGCRLGVELRAQGAWLGQEPAHLSVRTLRDKRGGARPDLSLRVEAPSGLWEQGA